jgi:DNA-binding SARP family transcriptional activator/tetratricopeptide (TPR) repeat protein
VLGPLEVWSGAIPLGLGAPKQRLLLAVLLCHLDQPLRSDLLLEQLWAGNPPASARANLRSYVYSLRRLLGHDVLVGHGNPGYTLAVEPTRIDRTHFVQLIDNGRGAVDDGDLDGGRKTLTEALDLWRGQPYHDVRGSHEIDSLVADRARMHDYRLIAQEYRIEADLRTGRASETVPELADLVAANPYHERFHGQLMRALYGSGRQAEALAAYRHAYDTLTGDLGIEPLPELRDLHDTILRGDPDPVSSERVRAVTARRPVPAQLPADVPEHFVGRATELAALSRPTAKVFAVVGVGGIGKTWLALRWAHENRHRFPDGQLFIDLRGFDRSARPVPPAVAVRHALDALGVPPADLSPDPQAQATLYRSLMADRRMLVVLDNARGYDQVLPLLPGSASNVVVVTSRDRLVELANGHGSVVVPVDVLDDAQARRLLVRRLGPRRAAAEPESVESMVTACRGLPLALAIAATRVTTAPELSLATVAAELSAAGSRLDALDEGDGPASLRSVLSWSYAVLPPVQARLFALLGLALGPGVGLLAAAALAGAPVDKVRTGLRALQRLSLVTPQGGGRWRMHDLVRLYAADRAAQDLGEPDRAEARRRLVDHLLHTAYAADRLLNPDRTPIDVGTPAPGAVVAPLRDEHHALVWLAAEHENLLAAQALSTDIGYDAAVWKLAWALGSYHRRSALSDDDLTMWHNGLRAAQVCGDYDALSTAHRCIGEAYAAVGRHDDAAKHLERALALAEQAGDVEAQARGHRALGWAMYCNDDLEKGIVHAEHALDLNRALGMTNRIIDGLNTVGWYHSLLGRHGQGRPYLEAALVMCRQNGLTYLEALTLESLNVGLLATGRHDEAETACLRGLELIDGLGHDITEVRLLEQLGAAHAARDDPGAAVEAWERARAVCLRRKMTDDADRLGERIRTRCPRTV